MVSPFSGPNVSRALSLVPEANRLFFTNVGAMYGGVEQSFYDLEWTGPISRPQAELLAARVSALNECFTEPPHTLGCSVRVASKVGRR